jgi:maleate isomerase
MHAPGMLFSMITIGVLTPHAEAGPEAELPLMAPGQVFTRLSRIPASDADVAGPGTPPTSPSGLRGLTAPSTLDTAAAAFPLGSVDALGYASTSTGYAIGFDAEAALVERLSHQWRLPVASTSHSAVAAMRAFDVQRVALVHPPWFSDQMNDLGAAYFRSQGFEVASSRSADVVKDPGRIEPVAVLEWITRHVGDDADVVFIGGNGFRAARAIAPLEARLGCLVLESNQVLLWSILAAVNAEFEVVGYGRLFGH